jgi:phage regulator Rha-like protein
MTSREIADLTGKRHADVLRDVDKLLKTLDADLRSGFSMTYEGDPSNGYRYFIMDRDSTYCLVAGYDANARMRIVKRWQELESQTPQLPDFTNPAEAARAWATEYDRAEQHRLAHEAAQKQLEAQAPAVSFHKQVTENTDDLMLMEEFCGLLKRKTGQDFNQATMLRALREFGIAKLENKYSGVGPKMFIPKAEYIPKWFVSTMSEGGKTIWMARPIAAEAVFQLIEQQRKNPDLLPSRAKRQLVRVNRSGRFFN